MKKAQQGAHGMLSPSCGHWGACSLLTRPVGGSSNRNRIRTSAVHQIHYITYPTGTTVLWCRKFRTQNSPCHKNEVSKEKIISLTLSPHISRSSHIQLEASVNRMEKQRKWEREKKSYTLVCNHPRISMHITQ
jgi:hypothetical protein